MIGQLTLIWDASLGVSIATLTLWVDFDIRMKSGAVCGCES